MNVSRRLLLLAGTAFGLAAAVPSRPALAWDGPLLDVVEGAEDFKIASDAYVFGYPLITMALTRRVMTNVAAPEGTRAPMGTIMKARAYPDASFRDVTAPNADTLYTPVRDQVNALSTAEYFTLLAELTKRNPPYAKDAPAVERIKAIGLVPGQSFDATAVDARWSKRLPQLSFDRIMLHFKFSDGDVEDVNGWGYTTKTGTYGTDYLQRALIAAIGLGANRPQDVVYPTSLKDKHGKEYTGAGKYLLRFAPGRLPPVKGFWSLTMYDENYFFVANPINRYSMSVRTNPTFEADGSLVIYVQNESPGAGKEANWLPAPKGQFYLMPRLYWPEENDPSILNGSWVIPAVTKA